MTAMTSAPPHHHPRRRARLAAVLGAAGLALAVAAPADAIYRGADQTGGTTYEEQTTVSEQRPSNVYDENGKKYCWKKTDSGNWDGYRDGSTTTYWDYATGKEKKYRCVDGTWVEVLAAPGPRGGHGYAYDYTYTFSATP
jgi:hypothetical protein